MLESLCQANTVLANKENVKLSHHSFETGRNLRILQMSFVRLQLSEILILIYRLVTYLPWAVSSMSGLVTESFPPKSELHSDLRSSILLGISSDVALIPYT